MFGQDVSFHVKEGGFSASISPCGRDVVLGSREGLHIIDLDSPYNPPRYLPHHTSWEVADVQWSPFASKDYWVVSTSNQKALVWNLAAKFGQDTIEHVLHGHTRAITDINFSAHHAEILATCAVDSFVHCWDLRTPARPAFSFSDWFAGATQVKWSRQDSHVLSSSHDRALHIWDDRKGAYPLHSIKAHDTKIYGVDWNRFEPGKVVTCSLDKTIKFWDLRNLEDGPERVIKTAFPVWRARHTPFGWGLLAMPQRSNYDLPLYDRRKDTTQLEGGEDIPEENLNSFSNDPVKFFGGHKGQVKEFLWRARGNIADGIDNRDFQLVTWGTDRELRLHSVDRDALQHVGYQKGATKTQRFNFTRRGATYKTFRDEPIEDNSPFSVKSGQDPPSFPKEQLRLRPRGRTSVGMSKVSLPQFRTLAQGTRNRKTGMHGRAKQRQDMSPIAWMKNVRTVSTDQESLAEEITQVGERFKKVDFEEIDVKQRRATISLHGPWGEQNNSVYLRLQMKFPELYPRHAHAKLTLHKTTSLSDDLVEKISTEMHTIADIYARHGRGCIEAVLRYLLRDQSLEQSISPILEDDLVGTKLFSTMEAGEVSSDDDDDPIQPPTEPLNSDAKFRVPLAKACGALWSDNGMLVCFFPPKPNKPSIMDSLELPEQDSSRSTRIFEGFGRLHTSSPGPRTTAGTKTTDDETLSQLSDDSTSSSSSSSGTSAKRSTARGGLPPRKAWHRSFGLLTRSRSAERSNQSLNGFGPPATTDPSRANVISIHDFSDLIPFDPKLALGYQIFGHGPDVCEHNATVALEQGNNIVASVWQLAKLILANTVPLEHFQDPTSGRHIITIAQVAANTLKRKDSGVDLSYDSEAGPATTTNYGRVRWGNSPLAPTYLIPALFRHYESLGNVQMLAMLSCVFAEPKSLQPEALLAPHRDQDLSIELKAPAFSVDYYPSLQVARSVTSLTAASNINAPGRQSIAPLVGIAYGSGSSGGQPDPTANGLAIHAHAHTHAYASRRPSAAASVVARDIVTVTGESSGVHSSAVSLSTSPEDSRFSRGSSSNLAFSFSRASLSALQQSYSSSPPSNSGAALLAGQSQSTKSGSPGSSSLAPGAWSASALFGGASGSRGSRASASQQPSASAASSDEQRATYLIASSSTSNLRATRRNGQESPETSRASNVTISGHNHNQPHSQQTSKPKPSRLTGRTQKISVHSSIYKQTLLDIDNHASIPLLDPKLEWKFKAYRASYAHLLGVWELYPQMAEILKFDGLVSYFKPAASEPWNLQRRKTMTEMSKAALSDRKGLELRRCCRECGEALNPIEKNGVPIGWHCTTNQCGKAGKREVCTICSRVIRGLMVPCLECGHVTCYGCAEGWFRSTSASTDADDDLRTQCPSGCGCTCPSLTTVSVPYPQSTTTTEDQDQDINDEKPASPLQHAHTQSEAQPKKPHTYLARQHSQRSERLMSTHGPDTAIGAFLSLTRTRSISAAKESVSNHGHGHRESMPHQRSESVLLGHTHPNTTHHHRENQRSVSVDEHTLVEQQEGDMLDPWAGGQFAGLGRGYGGGLSRGLSRMSSDATIRKVDKDGR